MHIFKNYIKIISMLCLIALSGWVCAQANHDLLLPSNRIVAYYGNFYSPNMGILGQYPPDEVLKRLEGEVSKWRAADPNTKVLPAIEYIAVVAQGAPGKDGKYRQRMPAEQIQKAIALANQINGIAILDIQIGLSTVEDEIAYLAPYLALPNVMLGLDPEFSMRDGGLPGKKIGTMDAKEVNYAANYLQKIITDHNLPPKVLIVHRFTQHMLTNDSQIKQLPQVQILLDMDGWGPESLKTDSYKSYVAGEPIPFKGMKLFYKNDVKAPSKGMFTPEELMKFKPVPIFIMYQ